MTAPYSFARPHEIQPCVFVVLYNGEPVAEHATVNAALDAIDRLAALVNTSARCFRIRRERLS